MSFYKSIAEYYQQIFPLNPMQLKFVENSISPRNPNLSILDIGCAIGDLSIQLSKQNHKLVGIDLDSEMIKYAKARSQDLNDIEFRKENMLNIGETFGKDQFDMVLCFGNTLVHLASKEDVLRFFVNVADVLNEGGKLLFQIINYDRVLDKNITELPTIENDKIKFERNYHHRKTDDFIDFETILTIKQSNRKIENCIPLLAIRQQTIDLLLKQAGFKNIQYYGNFKREELKPDSMPLIVEAQF